MTRLEAIDALLEKVKAGEWDHRPNAEARVVFPYKSASADDLGLTARAAFEGSTDAALALIEAVLPGWGWSYYSGDGHCILGSPDPLIYAEAHHYTPAHALLIAILEAMKAQEEANV